MLRFSPGDAVGLTALFFTATACKKLPAAQQSGSFLRFKQQYRFLVPPQHITKII